MTKFSRRHAQPSSAIAAAARGGPPVHVACNGASRLDRRASRRRRRAGVSRRRVSDASAGPTSAATRGNQPRRGADEALAWAPKPERPVLLRRPGRRERRRRPPRPPSAADVPKTWQTPSAHARPQHNAYAEFLTAIAP